MRRLSIIVVVLFIAFIEILPAQGNYEFGPSIRVNDDPAGIHDHYMLSAGQHLIGCRGDTVYLVWSDERANLRRIYFSRSTDAGNVWSTNLRLSSDNPDHEANTPSLTLDNLGKIYVCYAHYDWNTFNVDVYFTRSTDGGLSFSSPVLVNDTTRAAQDHPSIAVDTSGQVVYVAWQDTRNSIGTPNFDIYGAKSTDGGLTFGPSVRVDDTGSDTLDQQMPSIGCTQDVDTVYVTWWDERNDIGDSNLDIYFSRSIDGGTSFESDILVNDTVGTTWKRQWDPSLWVDNSGTIYVVWDDGYYTSFAKSIDCGLSFIEERIVNDDITGGGCSPSLCSLKDSLIYVTWMDARTYSQTGYDIYFSFSADAGDSFSVNVRVNDLLGIESAWDWYPSVCVNDSGKVFVAWESDRNDASHANSDIYFAAGRYVGIMEFAQQVPVGSQVRVFPNPCRNHFTVRSHRNDIKYVEVFDVTGRSVILKKNGSQTLNAETGIDTYGLPCGVYFVKVVGEDTIVKKVIKIK